jgi:hypothetical protein
MVTAVKHEWHQVDSQFLADIDEALLIRIYPELDDIGIAEKLHALEEGDIPIEEIIQDANDNNVDIDWDRDYDDWWTERKGGFQVTYEVKDNE